MTHLTTSADTTLLERDDAPDCEGDPVIRIPKAAQSRALRALARAFPDVDWRSGDRQFVLEGTNARMRVMEVLLNEFLGDGNDKTRPTAR